MVLHPFASVSRRRPRIAIPRTRSEGRAGGPRSGLRGEISLLRMALEFLAPLRSCSDRDTPARPSPQEFDGWLWWKGLRRPPRDVQRSRTWPFAAITTQPMGASDEGIGCERPCPGMCRIGEAKGVRAPCVVARSLPFADEKNRPGRSQSLRRWPLPIYRVVQARNDHSDG